MICFYHLDHDGHCAASLVHQFDDSKNKRYYEINYNQEFPFNMVKKNERVYIVDYSILPKEMDKLLKITKDVVWIDHHVSAIQRYDGYDKEIKGIRRDGTAGCELTWEWFNKGEKIPKYIEYIGDRDVWRYTNKKEEVDAFCLGLDFYDTDPTADTWLWLLSLDNSSYFKEIIRCGKTCIEYRRSYASKICDRLGFETTFEGHKAFCINMPFVSSDDFITTKKYPLLIGYFFNGDTWTYSLRANSDKVNCSKIAMKYGGGGHKGAAGFSSKKLLVKK